MPDCESAEWTAIISECIESGAFAWAPPPMASNGVNELPTSKLILSRSGLDFVLSCRCCFDDPPAPPLATWPLFRAPPSKPGR